MSEKYACHFCSKIFSSKSNLNTHMRTAKYCLDTRKNNAPIEFFICDKCDKNFTTKQKMQSHQEKCECTKCFSCKKLRDENEELKQKYKDLEEKYEKLREDNIQALKKQLSTYEEKCKDTENKLFSTLENVAMKPSMIKNTNNTQTINTLISKLDPLVYEDIQKNIQENYTKAHFKKTHHGLAEVSKKPLKNKVICTDPSRRVLKYKEPNGEIITDVGGNKMTKKIITKPFMKKVMEDYDEYHEEFKLVRDDKKTSPADYEASIMQFLEISNYKTDIVAFCENGDVKDNRSCEEFVRLICIETVPSSLVQIQD